MQIKVAVDKTLGLFVKFADRPSKIRHPVMRIANAAYNNPRSKQIKFRIVFAHEFFEISLVYEHQSVISTIDVLRTG